MNIHSDPKFIEYKAKYPEILRRVKSELDETDLELILEAALLLSYLLENKIVTNSNDDAGVFSNLILTKLSQELFALYWTLRGASIYGAAHVVRSIMEIYATTHYIAKQPKKRDRRVSKFIGYRPLAMYGEYTYLKAKLDAREIDNEEFNARNVIKPGDVESVTEEQRSTWRKLYAVENDEWHKVRWHSPTTIEALMEQTDLSAAFKQLYGSMCHLTHVSPLSKGMFGNSLIMQSQHIPRARDFLQGTLISLCYTLKLLDQWHMPGLLSHFGPIFQASALMKGVRKEIDDRGA